MTPGFINFLVEIAIARAEKARFLVIGAVKTGGLMH